jgi:hypothetical protein
MVVLLMARRAGGDRLDRCGNRPGHITLQIAYLPTLYSAFNLRETEVTLLNARAGAPSWGPELLMRTPPLRPDQRRCRARSAVR